jgi:hypothetical protein
VTNCGYLLENMELYIKLALTGEEQCGKEDISGDWVNSVLVP